MMTMRTILLLSTCMIAGVPRSPVEGVQTVSEEDAERLIDAKMAEYADIELEVDNGDDGDDLDKKNVKQLQAIVKKEAVTVEGKPDKPGLLAAIRAHRDAAKTDDLDEKDDAELKAIVADEEVEVAEDATADAMRVAIRLKRNPADA